MDRKIKFMFQTTNQFLDGSFLVHLQPPQLRCFTKKADDRITRFLGGLIEDPFVILAPWGPSEAEQGPETWGLGVKLPWLSVNIKMLVVGGWATIGW